MALYESHWKNGARAPSPQSLFNHGLRRDHGFTGFTNGSPKGTSVLVGSECVVIGRVRSNEALGFPVCLKHYLVQGAKGRGTGWQRSGVLFSKCDRSCSFWRKGFYAYLIGWTNSDQCNREQKA